MNKFCSSFFDEQKIRPCDPLIPLTLANSFNHKAHMEKGFQINYISYHFYKFGVLISDPRL